MSTTEFSAERPIVTAPRRRRRVSFGRRFHAWWEGYDLPVEYEEEEESAEPLLLTQPALDIGQMKAFTDDLHKDWPKSRIEAAEIIWGDDMVVPGGPGYAAELARPFGLGPAVSLLDTSAGLGGGTRMLVSVYGVWVTGLEADADLAEEGNRRSKMHEAEGMDRKAPIRIFDPERFELKPRSFDCILGRESYYRVGDKGRLLSALHRGLKDRGQLIFTDILLSGEDRRSELLDAWYEADSMGEARPWTLAKTTRTLESLGFDLRISEDITTVYRGHIMRAWTVLADRLNRGDIPKHLLKPVSEEADRWSRRVAAIDMGDLSVVRFHAIKPPEG
jgi:SAM-dependent methyltransferase